MGDDPRDTDSLQTDGIYLVAGDRILMKNQPIQFDEKDPLGINAPDLSVIVSIWAYATVGIAVALVAVLTIIGIKRRL